MRKMRNFFIAVLGFFCLSVALNIFSEVVWVDRDAAAVVAAPAIAVQEPTTTPEGDPSWLIPYDHIAFHCDHPWVIRRTLDVLDQKL